ncbi:MAG: hypothetical protein RLZZ292_909 [Bacteroidota bacterium]|jgi:hypothetical protein
MNNSTVINNALSSYKHTQIVSNLSRQKMLVSTICAMLKSRSVSLSELAYHLNDSVKTDSNETRLREKTYFFSTLYCR